MKRPNPCWGFDAVSEACWINKYSRGTLGYVFFMSSLCYQKWPPLRGSDASIADIIFPMNNLLEKPVLSVSVRRRQWRVGAQRGVQVEQALPSRCCRGLLLRHAAIGNM